MRTKLSDLVAELTAEERREVQARAGVHLRAMEDAERLDQVRKAASRTQSEIADLMGIGQNAVSQLEKRDDIQLSTLDRYVRSLGLRLELAVVGESGERVVLRNYHPWRMDGTAKGVATSEPRVRSSRRKAPAQREAGRESAVASKDAVGPRRTARKAAKKR